MPFFSRHEPAQQQAAQQPAPQPAPVAEPKRSHGFFGNRNREVSPTPTYGTASTKNTSGSYQASPERAGNASMTGRRSLLRRSGGNGNADVEMDPSIVQARERVMGAEAAERDADRALWAARESVRDAREQVHKLELEAQEEARRAKAKQYHAREVSKRARPLGRYD